MCEVSALKKTDRQQTYFKLCSVPPDRTRIQTYCNFLSANCNFCKLKCCFKCIYCPRAVIKGCMFGHCKIVSAIKVCEQCFLCISVVFRQTCPKCCTKSACRGQSESVWGNLGSLGGRTQSIKNIERRDHPTFPNRPNQVTHNHQLLCTSPQIPLPVGGIASAHKQKCSRVGKKSSIYGLLQPAIFGPQTKQQVETYTRPE